MFHIKLFRIVLFVFLFLGSLLKAENITIPDTTIKELVQAIYHTLIIKSDGTLWGWGENSNGQLGDGSTNPSSIPKQIGTDTDWKTISSNNSFTLGLKTNGTLWAWGKNYDYQLGDGTPNNSLIPKQIGTDTDWKTINNASATAMAIKNNNTLWAWGSNSSGQIGNGTTDIVTRPQQIGSSYWKEVKTSDHWYTVGIKMDGTLWTWGKLTGIQDPSFVPKQIGTDRDWHTISCSVGTSIALKTNGTLWGWGRNDDGILVDNHDLFKYSPLQIGQDEDWVYINTGTSNAYAIKSNGTLWGSGFNLNGFIQIGQESDWKLIKYGYQSGIVLKNDNISILTLNSNRFTQAPELRNIVEGSDVSDTIIGSNFDDRIKAKAGNDTINGKEGQDTLILSGNKTDYQVLRNPNGTYTITGPDGVDTLTNIELLDFDDIQNIDINSISNSAPSIDTLFDNINIEEDSISNFSINVSDLDKDILTLDIVSSNPSLLTVDKTWESIVYELDYFNKDLNFNLTTLNHDSGISTITVTLGDGKHSTVKTFDVTVTAVDDTPIISNNTIVEAKKENFSDFNITIDASDEEGDIFTLSATSLTSELATVSLNKNILTVSSVPWAIGEVQIEVKAIQNNNHSLVSTKIVKFQVNYNDPTAPSINTYFTDISLQEDQPNYLQNFKVGDINGDNLTINITSSNPSILGVTKKWNNTLSSNDYINGLNFSLFPIENQNGTATITVTVSDDTHTTTQSFSVSINPVDDAPTVISNLVNISKDEDFTQFSIPISTNDIENDTVVLSTQSTPSGIIDVSIENDTLVISAIKNENGIATVKVTATANGLSSTKEFSLTVNNIDDAPTIEVSIDGTITTDEDIPFTQTITYFVVDADGDDIVTDISSSNPNLVNVSLENGKINLDLIENAYGDATITLSATANGKTTTDSFNIVVNSIEDPLVFVPISSKIKDEDFGYIQIPLTVSDDDSITLSVTSSNSDLVNISINNSILYISSKYNQNGTSMISVTAKTEKESITRSFLLTVLSIDDAPTMNTLSDMGVDLGYGEYKMLTYPNDAEGDDVTLSVTSSDTNLVNVSTSGNYIIFKSDSNTTGQSTITVNATSNGKTTSKYFKFYIYNCYDTNNIGQTGKGAKCWNQTVVDNNWMNSNIKNAIHLPNLETIFTGQVTDMSGLFKNKSSFNSEDILEWDTSNVTNMSEMFYGAISFNQDISEWDTRNVTNMNSMFEKATVFSQDLTSWYVGENPSYDRFAWDIEFQYKLELHPLWGRTDIAYNKNCQDPVNIGRVGTGEKCKNQLIADNTLLRDKIRIQRVWESDYYTGYYTGQVTDMSGLFKNDIHFNKNISNWDTSNVTNMSEMFSRAETFNQYIGSWDTSSVTNMNQMFYQAKAFTNYEGLPLEWDTSNVINMSQMFESAENFNQNISNWKTSNVTNMYGMFKNALQFNQDISNWKTSNVTNMDSMFENAISFKQDLKLWCVSKIVTKPINFDILSNMELPLPPDDFDNSSNTSFKNNVLKQPQWGKCLQEKSGCHTPAYVGQTGGASLCKDKLIVNRTLLDTMIANGDDVSNVYTGQITDMSSLLDPGSPDVSNIYTEFNQDISNWDVSNVTNMSFMFVFNKNFNQYLGNWDVSNVTNMSGMFQSSSIPLEGIGLNNWDTSNVNSIEQIFLDTKNPPASLHNWCFPKIKNAPEWFEMNFDETASWGPQWGFCGRGSCYKKFNVGTYGTEEPCDSKIIVDRAKLVQMITNGDDVTDVFTGMITDMSELFTGNYNFNQDISKWYVSNVTNMSGLFTALTKFNQNLNEWDTSKVTDMSNMFYGASSFNQNIASWDTLKVTNMSSMFNEASSFNQNIASWDVSSVNNMYNMFNGASSFNGDITQWDVSNVTNMNYMFSNANSFNQNLEKWYLGNIKSKPIGFDLGSPLANNNSFQPDWGKLNRNLKDIIIEYEEPNFATSAKALTTLLDGIVINYEENDLSFSDSSLNIIGKLKLDEKTKCTIIPSSYAEVFTCILNSTDAIFGLGLSKFAKDGYPIIIEYSKGSMNLERSISFTFANIIDSFYKTPEISGLRTSFAFKSMDLTVGSTVNYTGKWSVNVGIEADSFIKPSVKDEYVAFSPSIDIEISPVEPIVITLGGEIKKQCGNTVSSNTKHDDCKSNWNPLGLGLVSSDAAMLKIGFTATTPPIPKSLNMFIANGKIANSDESISAAITTSLEMPEITDDTPYQGAIFVYADEISSKTLFKQIPYFNTDVQNAYNNIANILPKVKNLNIMVSTMKEPFSEGDFETFAEYFTENLSSKVNKNYEFEKPGFVISGNFTKGVQRYNIDISASDLVFSKKLQNFSDILYPKYYTDKPPFYNAPNGNFNFNFNYMLSNPTLLVRNYLPLSSDSICKVVNCGSNSLGASININTVMKNQSGSIFANGNIHANILGINQSFEVSIDKAINPKEIVKETANKICSQSILKPVCNTLFQILKPLINVAVAIKDSVAKALGSFASKDIAEDITSGVMDFAGNLGNTLVNVTGDVISSIGGLIGGGNKHVTYPIADYIITWPVFDQDYYKISWNNGNLNHLQEWLGHPNAPKTKGMSKWFYWYDYIYYNPKVANSIGYKDSLVQHDERYFGDNSDMSAKTKIGHAAIIYWQNKNVDTNMYDGALASSKFSAPYVMMRYPECQNAKGSILFEKAINCYKNNKTLKTIPKKNDEYIKNSKSGYLACRAKVQDNLYLRSGFWNANGKNKYTVSTQTHKLINHGVFSEYEITSSGHKYYDRYIPNLTCEIGNNKTNKADPQAGFEVLKASGLNYISNSSIEDTSKLVISGVDNGEVYYLCKTDNYFGHATLNGQCIVGEGNQIKTTMQSIKKYDSFEFATANNFEWIVPEGKSLSITYKPSDPELFGCKVYVNNILVGKMASDKSDISINVEADDLVTFSDCSHYDKSTGSYISWNGTLSNIVEEETQNTTQEDVIHVNPITTILSGKFYNQGNIPKDKKMEAIKEIVEVLTDQNLSELDISSASVQEQLMSIINKSSNELYTDPIIIKDANNNELVNIDKPNKDAVAFIAVVATAIETAGMQQKAIEYDSKLNSNQITQIGESAFDSLVSFKTTTNKDELMNTALKNLTKVVTDQVQVKIGSEVESETIKLNAQETLTKQFKSTLEEVKNTIINNGDIQQVLIDQSKTIQNSDEIQAMVDSMKSIGDFVASDIIKFEGINSTTTINTSSDINYSTNNVDGNFLTLINFDRNTTLNIDNKANGKINFTINNDNQETKFLGNIDGTSVLIEDSKIITSYIGDDYIVYVTNDINGSLNYSLSKNNIKSSVKIHKKGSITSINSDGTLQVNITVNEEIEFGIRLEAFIYTDKEGNTQTSFIKVNKETNETVQTINTLDNGGKFPLGSTVEFLDNDGVYSIETTTPIIQKARIFSVK